MRTQLLTVVATTLVCATSGAHAERDSAYRVATVQRESLLGVGSNEKLTSALFNDGIVSITDIQGFAGLRYTMLQELNKCAHVVPGGRKTMPRFEMHDHGNTLRYSAAATITRGKLDRMDEPRVCEGFLKAAESFRRIVDEVVNEFVSAVDEIAIQPSLEKRSIAELALKGDQLEHFHFFDKVDKPVENLASNVQSPDQHFGSGDAVLDVHTDHGFFVVFIPASYWLVAAEEGQDPSKSVQIEEALGVEDDNGFMIEVQGKGIVQPKFASRDSLVFMAGDAMAAFDSRFHVPRHTVNTVKSEATRSWYGRMLVPPEDYKMLAKDAADGGAMTTNLGCTSGRRVLDALGGCEVGTSYCWHRCQAAPPCAEGEELMCVNTRADSPWDPDSHCGCFTQCRNATDFSTRASDSTTYRSVSILGLLVSSLGVLMVAF